MTCSNDWPLTFLQTPVYSVTTPPVDLSHRHQQQTREKKTAAVSDTKRHVQLQLLSGSLCPANVQSIKDWKQMDPGAKRPQLKDLSPPNALALKIPYVLLGVLVHTCISHVGPFFPVKFVPTGQFSTVGYTPQIIAGPYTTKSTCTGMWGKKLQKYVAIQC